MFFKHKLIKNNFLDFKPFLVDGRLYIPSHYWTKINNEFCKEEIKRAMAKFIVDNSLIVPGGPTVQESLKSFNSLKSLDTKKLLVKSKDNIFTRHDYLYGVADYYIQMNNIGNDASDFFQRDNRMRCGTFKFDSPYKTWTNYKKLNYALNALWSMKVPEVNPNSLFNCLALRQYAASQFRVSAAKTIYELFNAKIILDTSSGWGDRFAGFSAANCTEYYLGIDPNTKLHKGYKEQRKFYGTGKKSTFLCAPAENVILPRNTFDLMFTSPPYFETERYSEEETQSWKNYKTLDKWRNDFLYKLLKNVWKSLKPGGYLAINIADLGVSYKDRNICDQMNDYIKTLPGANYVGNIGFRLATRPNTSIDKRINGTPSIFIEPIWCWRKSEAMDINELINDFKTKNIKNII